MFIYFSKRGFNKERKSWKIDKTLISQLCKNILSGVKLFRFYVPLINILRRLTGKWLYLPHQYINNKQNKINQMSAHASGSRYDHQHVISILILVISAVSIDLIIYEPEHFLDSYQLTTVLRWLFLTAFKILSTYLEQNYWKTISLNKKNIRACWRPWIIAFLANVFNSLLTVDITL